MDESIIQFIVSRIIDNARDALNEAKQNKDDVFYAGRKLAYYEMLDTIKNELVAREQNLEEFGLDINLEKTFL